VSRSPLNANQERRLGIGLRMLRQEMAAIASWPEMERAGEPYGEIRGLLERLRAAVASLEASLGLPSERPIPTGRRLAATAEVWATRMVDLHARHLRAYGKVHPELASVLDPRLDELIGLLDALGEAGLRLPPR